MGLWYVWGWCLGWCWWGRGVEQVALGYEGGDVLDKEGGGLAAGVVLAGVVVGGFVGER